jgi:hypothetical protein
MSKKFKVEHVEQVRSETYQVTVNAGVEGALRINVYPGNKLAIFSDSDVEWLPSDLSDAQLKRVLNAVKSFKSNKANLIA